MGSANIGKEFESIFENLVKSEGFNCIRFHDTFYEYKDIKNPCDFVISKDRFSPSILIECKATDKSSFDLRFRQLDELVGLDKFISYVVIWFRSDKEVFAIPTGYVKNLVLSGINSINPHTYIKRGIEVKRICSTYKKVKPLRLEVSKLWETS